MTRIRIAALIVEEGKVLLVEHAKNQAHYWLLPGGGLETGEDMKATLVRELKEEIDLEIKAHDLVLVTESTSPDASRHIIQMVFTASRQGEPRVTGQDERVAGVHWLDAETLSDRIFYPNMKGWVLDHLRDDDFGPAYMKLEWTP